MQENEFEKQVKDIMAELDLPPSEPVWENIKKQITKKKRRLLPYFLLLITVAIISGYLVYFNQQPSNQKTSKKYTTSDNIKSNNSYSDTINNKRTLQQNSISEIKISKLPALKKDNLYPITAINSRKKNENLPLYQSLLKQNNYKKVTVDTIIKNSITQTYVPELQKTYVKQQDDSINIFKDSILNTNTDTLIKTNKDFVKNDLVAGQKQQVVKKITANNKWQWGVSAMYGNSVITDNLLSLDFNKSASFNLNNPDITSRDISTLRHPYNTATAHNFGIIAAKKISRHSFVNTGLNFVRLNVKSNTARNIDSSLILIVPDIQNSSIVNGYYRAGSAGMFMNSFNFISLPVTFQTDLFHIKKFAVSSNTGISVRQLLSSKSLIYNDHNNSFFSNESLLRHTQFQIIAGLNLQLTTKKTGAFLLSPHFEYSFSTLLKNNDYNRLHFINYGLQAAWLFKKK